MKDSFTIELKDDENHSMWNMFNKWCNDVTKEKEKENKKLKKEADKLLKATRKLEKVCGMPKDSMAVRKDPNADPNAPISYGTLAPVVTSNPLSQLKVQAIYPPQMLGGSLEDINIDSYTYEELREIVFGDDNKAALTEKTIEKILDKYPTFFDEQDLELADHDSDKRLSMLFKEKPMYPPSVKLYLQKIQFAKPKKRGKK